MHIATSHGVMHTAPAIDSMHVADSAPNCNRPHVPRCVSDIILRVTSQAQDFDPHSLRHILPSAVHSVYHALKDSQRWVQHNVHCRTCHFMLTLRWLLPGAQKTDSWINLKAWSRLSACPCTCVSALAAHVWGCRIHCHVIGTPALALQHVWRFLHVCAKLSARGYMLWQSGHARRGGGGVLALFLLDSMLSP